MRAPGGSKRKAMSPSGQKRTFAVHKRMSALPPIADIQNFGYRQKKNPGTLASAPKGIAGLCLNGDDDASEEVNRVMQAAQY